MQWKLFWPAEIHGGNWTRQSHWGRKFIPGKPHNQNWNRRLCKNHVQWQSTWHQWHHTSLLQSFLVTNWRLGHHSHQQLPWGQLFPPRQKIGLVNLIPKQDKDPKHITNLRPITLLPTFYKIASGVLTSRLKPILDRIISPWQKSYLPNRFIGDVTRNTFDLF